MAGVALLQIVFVVLVGMTAFTCLQVRAAFGSEVKDRDGLVAIQNSISSAASSALSGWNAGTLPCTNTWNSQTVKCGSGRVSR